MPKLANGLPLNFQSALIIVEIKRDKGNIIPVANNINMFFSYIPIGSENIKVMIIQITEPDKINPIPFFPATDSSFLVSFKFKNCSTLL